VIRAAFRVPGFGRLYAGLTASMFGDSLMLIVLGMWVKQLTGSSGAAGLTFLWMTAPALVAPLLGYVVDRVPRRTFLIWANLGSALVMTPLLLVHDETDVWLVYAVAFLYGVSAIVVPAALNGLLKDLLPDEVLVEANTSLAVTREGLRLVGPLLGAGLFAVAGGGAVAMVDAATFLVAALAVAAVHVEERAHEEREVTGWWAEVSAGGAFIRRTPVLLHATVSLGLALLVIGFAESAIFAVVDAFHRPVTFVGPLVTAQGVGAVLAGLAASRLVRRWGEPRTIAAGLLVTALGLAGVALAQELWQLFVAIAVLGAGIPPAFVSFTTLVQRRTPGPLMGRVSTSVEVLVTTPQAVSIALGALLVSLIDYRAIFVVMAVGTAAAVGYLVLALRGRMRPTEDADPPPIPGTLLPEPSVVNGVVPPTEPPAR